MSTDPPSSAAVPRTDLPAGTVTFLFSDIEGSTRLVQAIGDERFLAVIEQHHALLRQSFETNGGVVIRTEGDAFFAVFDSATAAVAGAADSQRALAAFEWPEDAPIRVRIGLHTGDGRIGGDDYVGLDVHRAARISASGSGGQIVVSTATASRIEAAPPPGTSLRDLGSHRLKDLAAPEHMYQVDIEGLQTEFPQIRSLMPSRLHLPALLPAFIGRSEEIESTVALVRDHRLVTLTGPGGTGKTRLAIEAARAVSDSFRDGTFFVSLADVRDPDLVPAAILDATGAEQPGSGVDLVDYLIGQFRDQETLLVLDNYEHLLDATMVVATMLEAAPLTHVLATSRSPLHVSGEREKPVSPLPVPTATEVDPQTALSFSSVELFNDRARAVNPGFAVTQDNTSAVVDLVTKLDGLPLAIELAAARTKTLTVQAIVDRLGDRLLSGGKGPSSRQRTLNNTIRWSYNLLPDTARDLFEELAIFSGGAALEQIELLVSDRDPFDVWDDLATLVDHSLVIRWDVRGVPRFRMLETIRTFAVERLVERPDAKHLARRHAEIYLQLAEDAGPHLTKLRRAEWLDRLSIEHGNLHAAIVWSTTNREVEFALRLVAALWRFWQMRGHLDTSVPLIEAALRLDGGSVESRAAAYEAAGGVAYWRGDPSVHELYLTALGWARKTGDDATVANALYNVTYTTAKTDSDEAAEVLIEEAAAIYRNLDDRAGLGRLSWLRGNLRQLRGDHAGAVSSTEDSLTYFDPVEDPFDYGWAEFLMAENLAALGEFERAELHLRAGVGRFLEAGDTSGIVLFLGAFAQLAYERGDQERAMRIAGAMKRLRGETGTGLVDSDDPTRPVLFSDTGFGDLTPDLYAAFEAGKLLDLEDAIAYAIGK